jgi:CO/xanthine dehydrogenase Mo-binding subunit
VVKTTESSSEAIVTSKMPNIPAPDTINNIITDAIGAWIYELPIDSASFWKTIRGIRK